MATAVDVKSLPNPSFVLQEQDKVVYEDRPLPVLDNPGDVIVQVKQTGICGSDVHYWQHGRIGQFIVDKPMVLGHESSGIIHEAGKAAIDSGLRKGDRVALEPGIPCRRCARCKSGRYNLCPDMRFAATPPYDGTLSRFFKLPGDLCYKLPDHVTLEEGALVEPLSVAVHIVKQSGLVPGDKIVVFGAGPVGLLCLAVARAFGASTIVAVDINEARVDFAKSYAATHTFRPKTSESPEDSAARLIQECKLRDGADVALDASGAEVCMQQAVHVLRNGGTYVQGGMGKPNVNWPIGVMTTRELTIKGSFRYGPGDWDLSVELLGSGRISVKELITKKVSFEDAEQAFNDTKAAKGIKILIGGPADP